MGKRPEKDESRTSRTIRFFENLLWASNDGIVIIDSLKNIVEVNDAFCLVFGRRPKDMVGTNLSEWLTQLGDDTAGRWVELEDLLRRERYCQDREFKIAKTDQTMSVTASFIENRGEEDTGGIISIWHDVTNRKQAEKLLAAEREQLSVTLRSIGDGVITTDIDGEVVLLNKVAENLTGWSQSEAAGKPIKEVFNIVNEQTREAANNPIDKVLKFGKIVGLANDTILISRDGTERPIADSCAPIRDSEGRTLGAVLVFRDVTRQKLADQVLKAREERYRAIAQSAVDAIVTIDNRSDIVYWNKAATKIFGYSAKEAVGKPLTLIMSKQHHSAHQNGVKRVSSNGNSKILGSTIEITALRKSGYVFPIELSLSKWKKGDSVFFTGIIRDITKRKKMEKALVEESERLAVTLGSIGDGVIATDTDGRVVLLNRVAENLTGWTEKKAVGKPIGEVFHIINEKTRKRCEDPIKKVLKTGLIMGLANHTALISGDGTECPIADSCAPIRGLQGEILGAVLVFRDVTEQKILENERAKIRKLSDSLNLITRSINKSLDFDTIMQSVVGESVKAIGCETGTIALREGDEWIVSYVYGLPDKTVGLSLANDHVPTAGLAAKSMEPVVINDARRDERPNQKLVREHNVRSVLVVPLILRQETIGVLFLSYHSAKVEFSEAETDFSKKLTATITLALENARLYDIEHRIADNLQQALLALPERISGVKFHHKYRSATEAARVGGDFYDLFALDDEHVGIIIGDVSGKGLEAAAVTSVVKNTIKAYAHHENSPASIMTKTNQVMWNSVGELVFVTVFFGILNTKSGQLTYCNAGHPPAILKCTTGNLFLSPNSPIIGMFPDLSYIEEKHTLKPGETMVLYTDGIIEARRKKELFGEDRLVKLIEKSQPKDVAKKIFSNLIDFTGNKLADDAAILVISLIDQAVNYSGDALLSPKIN